MKSDRKLLPMVRDLLKVSMLPVAREAFTRSIEARLLIALGCSIIDSTPFSPGDGAGHEEA